MSAGSAGDSRFYGVLDVLMRAFVTDEDGTYLFDSRAEADALRAVEHAEKGGAYLIVSFDERPASAEVAIDSLPEHESRPVTVGPDANGGDA